MFGLSGIGLKIAIVAIIIATISAGIGGFWLYQKSIINGLNDKITEQGKTITKLQEKNASLILDKQKLEASNASLESEINRKATETKEAYGEITRLRAKDIESASRIQDIQKQLRDKVMLQRHEAVRNSRKASLLINLINKSIACYAENFDKVDGKCIRGKWVPDGGRLVPVAPPVNNKQEDTAK